MGDEILKVMYKAKTSYGIDIEAVEVTKESEKSVWCKEEKFTLRSDTPKRYEIIRYPKVSNSHKYFDSFEDAKAHVIQYAEQRISQWGKDLARAVDDLQKIKNFRCPTIN